MSQLQGPVCGQYGIRHGHRFGNNRADGPHQSMKNNTRKEGGGIGVVFKVLNTESSGQVLGGPCPQSDFERWRMVVRRPLIVLWSAPLQTA